MEGMKAVGRCCCWGVLSPGVTGIGRVKGEGIDEGMLEAVEWAVES